MKYKALRLISNIYLIAAMLVGGVILAITPSFSVEYINGAYQTLRGAPMVGVGIGTAIGGLVAAVGLLAFSELIRLFIDIEENTRRTSEYLELQLDAASPDEPEMPIAHSHPLLRKRPIGGVSAEIGSNRLYTRFRGTRQTAHHKHPHNRGCLWCQSFSFKISFVSFPNRFIAVLMAANF